MISADVLFLFLSAFLQLICLLPFLLIQLLNLCSYRQRPNNITPFLLTNCCVSGRAYSTMLTYLAWLWTLLSFCTEWDHSCSFWDVCCHFATHACMLVASCCLADPLYAPLCSFVDMAPSSVGRCQFCISAEVRFAQFSVELGRLRGEVGLWCLELLRNSCAA